MKRPNALGTLRHRDFRLLMLGQLVSGTGDQMQMVAIAWHIFVLTGSPLQVGIIGLLRAVPFMAFSILGGAVADSMERKRLLLYTRWVGMAVALALMAASLTGWVNVWVLYAVTALSGATAAFDEPTRQALVPNMVPRREVGPATSFSILLKSVTQLAGPGLGGVLIARLDLPLTYGIIAASSIGLVIAVRMMGPVPMVKSASTGAWERILGGLEFARKKEPIIWLSTLLDFFTCLVVSTRGFLPALSVDVLHVGAEGLGFLTAAASAGAMVGGVLMGMVRQTRHPVLVMMLGTAGRGLFLIGLGLAPTIVLAMVMHFLMGLSDVVQSITRNTIIQLRSPDEVRGRVSALGNFFSGGGPSLGQLESGAVAELAGPSAAAVIGGALGLGFVGLFAMLPAWRRELRPSRREAAAGAP